MFGVSVKEAHHGFDWANSSFNDQETEEGEKGVMVKQSPLKTVFSSSMFPNNRQGSIHLYAD